METNEIKVRTEVVRTDRLGREQRSVEERGRLMGECQSSGMSRWEFARQRGIKYKTLNEWFARSRRMGKTRGGKKSRSIELKRLDTRPLFGIGPVTAGVLAEIVLDGRWTIRLHRECSEGFLRQMMAVVRQSPL